LISAACPGAFGHAALATAWVRGRGGGSQPGMTGHVGAVEGELAACCGFWLPMPAKPEPTP